MQKYIRVAPCYALIIEHFLGGGKEEPLSCRPPPLLKQLLYTMAPEVI